MRKKTIFLIEKRFSQRYLEADKYFRSHAMLNKQQLSERRISDEFAVVVITRKRFVCNRNEFDCEPHYLQQTLAALDRESKWKSVDSIPIVVCSVDPHWDDHLDMAAILNYFPIILRYNKTGVDRPSNKKQESSDYAFCMDEARHRFAKTKYLVVVEDDAVVFENFFINLNAVVKHRIETNIVRGETVNNEPRRWCWMKL